MTMRRKSPLTRTFNSYLPSSEEDKDERSRSDLKRRLCCMHTAIEAHTEQSFTMFWMMSDGRSGMDDSWIGRFQVDGDREGRDG